MTGMFVPLACDSLSLVLLLEVPGWGETDMSCLGSRDLLGGGVGLDFLFIFIFFVGGV